MPEPEVFEALRASAEEVLETMFFCCLAGDDAKPESGGAENRAPAPLLSSRLSFRGAPSGVFEVGVSVPAARGLAANFLGAEEPEVSGKQVADVVCELANVLCGSVLSRFRTASVFDLSPPDLTPALDCPEASRYSFDIAGGMLTIALRFEEGA